MSADKISVAGIVLVVIAIAAMVAFVLQSPFGSFSYSASNDRFIGIGQNIEEGDSSFMWSYRSTDFMAQAFAIFAAAVACLAMLREIGREVPK